MTFAAFSLDVRFCVWHAKFVALSPFHTSHERTTAVRGLPTINESTWNTKSPWCS